MKITRGYSFADERIGAITASRKQGLLRVAALLMLLGAAAIGVGMFGFMFSIIRGFWADGHQELEKIMRVGMIFFAVDAGGFAAITIGGVVLSLYGYRESRGDLRALVDLLQGNAAQWKAGKWGEDRVVQYLSGRLDEQWRAFTNVAFLGIKGDIDLVLVGPKGVYAVEIKNWAGRIAYRDGSGWVRVKEGRMESLKDPARQVMQNAQDLKQIVNEEITPVIVFVHPKSVYVGDHPVVEAFTLEDFVPWLQSQPDRLTLSEIDNIAFAIEQVMKKE